MVEEVEVEALFTLKPRHLTRLIIMKSLLKLTQGMKILRELKEVTGRCFYSFQTKLQVGTMSHLGQDQSKPSNDSPYLNCYSKS